MKRAAWAILCVGLGVGIGCLALSHDHGDAVVRALENASAEQKANADASIAAACARMTVIKPAACEERK